MTGRPLDVPAPGGAPLWLGITTAPDEACARRLAEQAVSLGLAACAQLEPVQSVYRWQGQVEQATEWRVTFKCAPSAWAPLEAWVLAEHPYELPQWYGVAACAASDAYRAWVAGETATHSGLPSLPGSQAG